MSDFDYGNARLHAMRSRLLPPGQLLVLAESGSVQGLLSALTNTAYRGAVHVALVRLTGPECLSEALHSDLTTTLGAARRFFPPGGPAGELAGLVLRRYDVHNVKAVLRGLNHHLPPDEILAATLPAGRLGPADLAELARAPSERAAIDLLATWRVPLAAPLVAARDAARGRPLEPAALELALERWHSADALAAARATGDEGAALVAWLRHEADAANIVMALRLVGTPDAARAPALFVGPGALSFEQLAAAASEATVAEAAAALAGTRYGQVLAAALDDYAASARLSVFERALAREGLRLAETLYARDPLGIGVLLGYAAFKAIEVGNLRAIAQGLLLAEPAERIRAELLL
jgi:V/A-type H+-transporting ATPase subunit C